MAITFLMAGTKVVRPQGRHELLQRFDDGIWQVKSEVTGRLLEIHESELHEELRTGLLWIDTTALGANAPSKTPSKPHALWDSLPEDRRTIARARLRYVIDGMLASRTKAGLTPIIAKVAASVTSIPVPSVSTLKHWILAYISGGRDIAALAPRQHKSGNRASRVKQRVQEIVDGCIHRHYLSRERETMDDVRNHAALLIEAENRVASIADGQMAVPAIGYFYSRLEKYDAYQIHAARHGQAQAAVKFRNVLGYAKVDELLGRVECDHTPLDLFVIDEKSALPLGRPWLTVLLDVKTRCILGYALGFDPPSYASVAAAMMHAILPKSYLKKKYPRINNDWPCFGVFFLLAVDNGLEFHGNALEDAAHRLGIQILYCPRRKPWYKAAVERFIGTMVRSVAHGIPGTTFSNIIDKGDYDPSKHAVVTLDALNEIIHTWIADHYLVKTHRSLMDSPVNKWREISGSRPIPLPVEAAEMEYAFGIPADRTLTHRGIEIHNMFYNSEECAQLRRKRGDKQTVKVKFVSHDLGYVYLTEPDTGRSIKVAALPQWKDYADGLTLYQHKLCRKYAVQVMKRKQLEPAVLGEAKARIREIVEEQMFNKRRRQRKLDARHQHKSNHVVREEPAKAKPTQIIPFPPESDDVRDLPLVGVPLPVLLNKSPISTVMVPRYKPQYLNFGEI